MQSLPTHQQGLAGGIFNMLFRLSTAVALGISTAVYTSVKGTNAGIENPMLPYTKTFYVSIALSGFSVLFLPFVRLGTQGNHTQQSADLPSPMLSKMKEKGERMAVALRSLKRGPSRP